MTTQFFQQAFSILNTNTLIVNIKDNYKILSHKNHKTIITIKLSSKYNGQWNVVECLNWLLFSNIFMSHISVSH